MLTLNLVAPSSKKEIKLKRIFYVLKTMTNTLTVLTILLAITLLCGLFILRYHFQHSVIGSNINFENKIDYDGQIKNINHSLTTISDIQDNYYNFSMLLDEIMRLVPDNVILTSIKINKAGLNIIFNGRALNRDQLLIFKEGLEDSESFTDIVLPISNILKKDNIDFEITATLNLYGDS